MSAPAASPPAIPMLRAPAAADVPHDVFAPGGYEWWRFEARSDDDRITLVADFFEGDPFERDYLRRYTRFVRRPTKIVPPIPREHRAASWWVKRKDKPARSFHHALSADAEEVAASLRDAGGFTLRIGTSHLHRHPDGSFHLALHDPASQLRATLHCVPDGPAHRELKTFPSRSLTGANHHWAIPSSLYRITGHVEVGGDSFEVTGRGTHDHRWGTGPLLANGRRWMHGRILTCAGSLAFAAAWPSARSETGEVIVVQRDAEGGITTTGATAGWQGYPRELAVPLPQWHESHLHLANARVLERSAGRIRLLYDASFPGGEGEALCEVADPGRLTWRA